MPRDAIEMLTADHREVESLFQQVEAGGAEKDTVDRIVRELSIHDAIERELLYPLVAEKVPTDGERLAEQSLDEHQDVARLLADIEAAGDADRSSLLTELIRSVRDHVALEEGPIFSKLRTVSEQSELLDLGQRLEDARSKAPTHPHPHTPRSAAGARVAGRAASAVDRVRDAVKSRS